MSGIGHKPTKSPEFEGFRPRMTSGSLQRLTLVIDARMPRFATVRARIKRFVVLVVVEDYPKQGGLERAGNARKR